MPNSPSQQPVSRNIILKNRREELDRAQRAVLAEVAERGYDRASCFAIRLALEEALTNAFKHGNKGDPTKTVRLDVRLDSNAVEIEVEDQGDGFDPTSVPDPTQQENVEIPSGRGLTLMRAFMTEVRVRPPGNRIQLRYVRPGP